MICPLHPPRLHRCMLLCMVGHSPSKNTPLHRYWVDSHTQGHLTTLEQLAIDSSFEAGDQCHLGCVRSHMLLHQVRLEKGKQLVSILTADKQSE